VRRAANTLLHLPGLEAKTRQTVHMFEQTLRGSGSYCQSTNGHKLFLKLDLKLQLADQRRSLLQVSDGDSLWQVHGQGDSQTYSYVDLVRLREAAVKTNADLPPMYWMALGGLPRLLAKLEENFAFQSPKAQTLDGHPVWSVEGEWKAAALARLVPAQKDAILAGQQPRWEDLPPQIPHGVTLILGRDKNIPYWPYVFSFHRLVVVDEETGQTKRSLMVTWELFHVRPRPELNNRGYFAYEPVGNDIHIQHRTEHYIKLLENAAQHLPKRR
jgi:hypothetical protein